LYRSGNIGDQFFVSFALIALAWLLVIIDKLFKIRIPNFLYLAYYSFLIFTMFFGELLNFYHIFGWYDELVHYLAGILLSIVGIFIIVKMDNIGYLKFSILLLISILFVGFSSSIWEIIEFTIDQLFNANTTISLSNTISDMIMNFLGGITFLILLVIDNSVYKSRYIEKLVKKF
jgi:hypothetical protein